MAALRPWPAYNMYGGAFPPPIRYALKASETFNVGDLVKLDSTPEVLELSGADDTPILGVAAESAANVVESGFVMVWPGVTGAVFAITGDNAPVITDVDNEYGYIQDGDGIYTLDGTETSNVVFYVVGVDIDRALYFVTFLDADRHILA